MPFQEVRTVDLPQGRIAYRDSGSGEPLLFVHGWPLSSLTWRKVVPALEREFRCIAVDLMGAGETVAKLDGDFSMPAQARMLAAFLNSLGLRSVTLIAHDSGATIGRILAAGEPAGPSGKQTSGPVSRLVIFDTEVPGHVITRFALLGRAFRLPGSARVFGMLLRSRSFLHSRRLGFGNAVYDHSAVDPDELFASITEPILRSRDRTQASLKFFVEFDWHVVDTLAHDRLVMPKLVLWGLPIWRSRQSCQPASRARTSHSKLGTPFRTQAVRLEE